MQKKLIVPIFIILALLLGASFWAILANRNVEKTDTKAMRTDLLKAWARSETQTLTTAQQMPAEFYQFQAADSTMTFAEQWRHCAIYTCGQLAANLELTDNPYAVKDERPRVDLSKEEAIVELKRMYAYVRKVIETVPDEKLLTKVDFAKDQIYGWQLLYAVENHIIHHRGQCVVYLRLKGIKPVGYYGW